MIIPLNKGYRLNSDKYQWMVQKQLFNENGSPRQRRGIDQWESLSFHSTPEKAINHHAGVLVRTTQTQTLSEALEAIESIATELRLALTDQFTVEVVK